MSDEQINKIPAGFVVKGDVVSKGGTVFVYDVIDTDTAGGATTLTIREQVKHRPITAKWKVPEGQIVSVHGVRPKQAQGRVERDKSDHTVTIMSTVGDEGLVVPIDQVQHVDTTKMKAELQKMASDPVVKRGVALTLGATPEEAIEAFPVVPKYKAGSFIQKTKDNAWCEVIAVVGDNYKLDDSFFEGELPIAQGNEWLPYEGEDTPSGYTKRTDGSDYGFVDVSMIAEANERIASSRGQTVEEMAIDHMETVAKKHTKVSQDELDQIKAIEL